MQGRPKKVNEMAILSIALVILIVIVACYPMIQSREEEELDIKNLMSGTIEIGCGMDSSNEVSGTGFIVEYDGVKVISNAHIVTYLDNGSYMPFDHISGRFFDDDTAYELNVTSFDRGLDIAVLAFVDISRHFSVLSFGDSDHIYYGDPVLTVGNARGNGLSASSGVVSIPLININDSRAVRPAIQTSITINDGNSGGPLFDDRGQVIGMMSFRIRDSLGDIVNGMSFAVPSNEIRTYLDDVKV